MGRSDSKVKMAANMFENNSRKLKENTSPSANGVNGLVSQCLVLVCLSRWTQLGIKRAPRTIVRFLSNTWKIHGLMFWGAFAWCMITVYSIIACNQAWAVKIKHVCASIMHSCAIHTSMTRSEAPSSNGVIVLCFRDPTHQCVYVCMCVCIHDCRHAISNYTFMCAFSLFYMCTCRETVRLFQWSIVAKQRSFSLVRIMNVLLNLLCVCVYIYIYIYI